MRDMVPEADPHADASRRRDGAGAANAGVAEELEAAEVRALLPRAASFFGLGTVDTVESTPFGIGNDSFFVRTTAGEFVLRVLWSQTLEGIERELAVARQLASGGVTSSTLVVGEDGGWIYQEGRYSLTAAERIPGTHPVEPSSALRRAVGTVLARFHRSVTTLPSEPRQWLSRTAAFEEAARLPDGELRQTIQHRLEEGAPIFELGLPSGIIHGDLYGGNLIQTPEGGLAVLDLETAERNLFVVDMARTALDLCATRGAVETAALEDLLAGYEEVRPLHAAEVTHLPLAASFVSGAMAAWLAGQRNQKEEALSVLRRAASWPT